MNKTEIMKERARLYIQSCPDKDTHKATISKEFKKDLAKYLISRGGNASFLELGTSTGQTTQLLSIVCDRVVTIDNVLQNTITVDGYGLNNVEALCHDLYEDIRATIIKLDQHGPFDVSLIDAVHTYNHSLSDAKLSLVLGCNVLIFDDVGLFEGVHNAYQKVLNEAQRINIKVSRRSIGKLPGAHAHGDKTFKHSEGEILEFSDLDDERRELLIRRLNKEERMTDMSLEIINNRIENILDHQMSGVKEWVYNSGNANVIKQFETNSEIHQNTRNQFRDVIENETKKLLGKYYDCLPEGSLPDVLRVLAEIEEEFEVVPHFPKIPQLP